MLAQTVLILALLLILVGMIMVLLDAFSESLFWGLLVLLVVPVFGPIYSFVKWHKSQARNGFAMSLVGIVMAAAGLYGGGAQIVPGLAEQEIVKNLPSALPSDEPLPNEAAAAKIKIEDDEAEYDPILSTDKDKFSTSEIEALAPKEDKTVKSASRPKVRKVTLDVTELDASVGENVEVVFMDGSSKRGRLIASSGFSISIEELVSGGIISYEHNLEKIKSVLLLVDPGAAPKPPVVKKQDIIDEPQEDLLRPAPEVDTETNLQIETKPNPNPNPNQGPATNTDVETDPKVESNPVQNKSLVSPPVR